MLQFTYLLLLIRMRLENRQEGFRARSVIRLGRPAGLTSKQVEGLATHDSAVLFPHETVAVDDNLLPLARIRFEGEDVAGGFHLSARGVRATDKVNESSLCCGGVLVPGSQPDVSNSLRCRGSLGTAKSDVLAPGHVVGGAAHHDDLLRAASRLALGRQTAKDVHLVLDNRSGVAHPPAKDGRVGHQPPALLIQVEFPDVREQGRGLVSSTLDDHLVPGDHGRVRHTCFRQGVALGQNVLPLLHAEVKHPNIVEQVRVLLASENVLLSIVGDGRVPEPSRRSGARRGRSPAAVALLAGGGQAFLVATCQKLDIRLHRLRCRDQVVELGPRRKLQDGDTVPKCERRVLSRPYHDVVEGDSTGFLLDLSVYDDGGSLDGAHDLQELPLRSPRHGAALPRARKADLALVTAREGSYSSRIA
mmetsp:Transcript_13756/g.38771  ORF Transcript_13756/g.38771 Transcript_13756/m.38771 type:complete len:418 (-) Transcript_13756:641-1894(-)